MLLPSHHRKDQAHLGSPHTQVLLNFCPSPRSGSSWGFFTLWKQGLKPCAWLCPSLGRAGCLAKGQLTSQGLRKPGWLRWIGFLNWGASDTEQCWLGTTLLQWLIRQDPLMGNYGNVLPGAALIKNNLILIAASERTLLPILSSPFLLDL